MATDLSSVSKDYEEKIQCGHVTNKDSGWIKELIALCLSHHKQDPGQMKELMALCLNYKKQRPRADERVNGFRP